GFDGCGRRGGADGCAEDRDVTAGGFIRGRLGRRFEQSIPGFIPASVTRSLREMLIEAAAWRDLIKIAAMRGLPRRRCGWRSSRGRAWRRGRWRGWRWVLAIFFARVMRQVHE